MADLKQFSVRLPVDAYEALRERAFILKTQTATVAARYIRERLADELGVEEIGVAEEPAKQEEVERDPTAIELYDSSFDFSRLLPRGKK